MESDIYADLTNVINRLQHIRNTVLEHSTAHPVLMLTGMERGALRSWVSDMESYSEIWRDVLTRRAMGSDYIQQPDPVQRNLSLEMDMAAVRNVRPRREAYNNSSSDSVDSNALTQPMVPVTTPESKSDEAKISEVADRLCAGLNDPTVNDALTVQLRRVVSAARGSSINDIIELSDDEGDSVNITPA